MLLRDPVHGLVAFEGAAGAVVEPLLATREVQRLRTVRQLGLTSLAFPGAEHSRFAHAVGAAHVMGRLLERVRAVQSALPVSERLDAEAERDAVAAALLHDLGHGPFSHLFEEVMPHARPHEEWTAEAIRDPATDVHRALAEMDHAMPGRIADLLAGRYRLGYVARAVSGTLDVDRCDYLLRDSHMTGVSYGVYDLDWLLRALSFARTAADAEWVLAIEGRKGLPSAEGFFLARQFMFQQVYHHKATRAAECLIRGIFKRLAQLIRDGRAPRPLPPAIGAAVLGERFSLGEYLALDDVQLVSCFRAWERCSDAPLAELTQRLSARRLPKTLPLPDGPGQQPVWEEAYRRAREIARAKSMRDDLMVWLDVPTDILYREPDDESPDGLWVLLRHHPIQRLGSISFILGELRNKRVRRPRLIFPAEIRDQLVRAVEGLWP